MNLYLHIGTEKTGSSYLQSMMALNRESLWAKGYWFPLAGKREKHLIQGEVSPGNAQHLTDLIEQEAFDKINQLLHKHLADASAKQCQHVLLSNELLLLALSKEGRIALMQKTAQAAGYTEVHYLLVLRDPLDQALSLYKHRAKSGKVEEIEDWPAIHYHYGKGLLAFLRQAKNLGISLTCRKYDHQIDTICFRDWLGINTEELVRPENRVNPSLSISELLLIRQLRDQDELLPKIMYDSLINLPKTVKAKEPRIEAYYKAVLSQTLAKYSETWQLCNQNLPEETPLELPNCQAHESDNVMTFSTEQIVTIMQIVQKVRAPFFRIHLFLIRCKRRLGKLRSLFYCLTNS